MTAPLTELDAIELFDDLERALKAVQGPKLHQAIVDAPFEHKLEMARLFLGFITFYLVDEAERVLYIAASSDTEYYHRSVDMYTFNPKEYRITLDDAKNSIAQAIVGGEPVSTSNWDTLSRPRVGSGIARLNQASAGIGYSTVFPLAGPVKGALMYNFYQEYAIGEQSKAFMQRYTQLVGKMLKRTNS